LVESLATKGFIDINDGDPFWLYISANALVELIQEEKLVVIGISCDCNPKTL
jgi:hypothetical protein